MTSWIRSSNFSWSFSALACRASSRHLGSVGSWTDVMVIRSFPSEGRKDRHQSARRGVRRGDIWEHDTLDPIRPYATAPSEKPTSKGGLSLLRGESGALPLLARLSGISLPTPRLLSPNRECVLPEPRRILASRPWGDVVSYFRNAEERFVKPQFSRARVRHSLRAQPVIPPLQLETLRNYRALS